MVRSWLVGAVAALGVVAPLQGLRDPRVVTYGGVACAAPAPCVAVGTTPQGGAVLTISADGKKTTAAVRVGGPDTWLTGVACPAPNQCVVVGSTGGSGNRAGLVATFRAGVAGPARLLPSTGLTAAPGELVHLTLDAVACRTATACTAFGWRKERFNGWQVRSAPIVVELTDGVPGTPIPVVGLAPEPVALACPSPTTCLLVGRGTRSNGAVVAVENGVPRVARVVPDGATLSSVACTGPTSCLAAGYTGARPGTGGVLVPIIGGLPGTPVPVLKGHLDRITCRSATSCVAGGFAADLGRLVVVPIVGGRAQASRKVENLTAVAGISCSGASTCIAVGSNPKGTTSEGAVLPFSS